MGLRFAGSAIFLTILFLLGCKADRGFISKSQVKEKPVITFSRVDLLAGIPSLRSSIDGTAPDAGFNQIDGLAGHGDWLYFSQYSPPTIRRYRLSTQTFETLAGSEVRDTVDGGPSVASLSYPINLVTDGTFVYFNEYHKSLVRKVEIATGVVTTIAGQSGVNGSTDGVGAAARFSGPWGLVKVGGDLYVGDCNNYTIRKIEISSGTVTTVAGTAGAQGAVDATGSSARFQCVQDLATDGSFLYALDTYRYTIRKIDLSTFAVTTLTGTTGSSGFADGAPGTARFNQLRAVEYDSGFLYALDWLNHSIRRVDVTTGDVVTFAGTNASGYVNAVGTAARFSNPRNLGLLGGFLYTSEGNGVLRKVELATATVAAEYGTYYAGMNTTVDGTGASVRFRAITSLVSDGTWVYIGDGNDHVIRRYNLSSGLVETVAGQAGVSGLTDAVGTAARFDDIAALAISGRELYIAQDDCVIRKMNLDTFAVSTYLGSAGDCQALDGSLSVARIADVPGLFISDGYLYFTDQSGSGLRRTDLSSGVTTTLTSGLTDPSHLVIANGDAYIWDGTTYSVHKYDLQTGQLSLFAGGSGTEGFVNGVGSAARFGNYGGGLATDGFDVYLTDSENSALRKINTDTGEVTTLFGSARYYGTVDGTLSQARTYYPEAITFISNQLIFTENGSNLRSVK